MTLPPAIWDWARSVIEAGHFGERKAIVNGLERRDGDVLDVPCGTGIFSDLFGDDGYIGADLDERLLRHARKKFPTKKFERADALDLPYDDERFDTVLVIGFLHHIELELVPKALDEVQRVLRPGGKFLLIEDHPTRDGWNVIGRLLQRLDDGGMIRTTATYLPLLEERFRVDEHRPMRAGLWDYTVYCCSR